MRSQLHNMQIGGEYFPNQREHTEAEQFRFDFRCDVHDRKNGK